MQNYMNKTMQPLLFQNYSTIKNFNQENFNTLNFK